MTTTESDSPRRLLPRATLIMAIWFGGLTGVLEVAYLAYRKVVEHEFLWVSRDVVWMAPLGNALYFAVVGLLLVAFARGRPSVRAAVTAFTALGVLCLALQFAFLHWLAFLAISLGVGMQVGRAVAARAPGFERLVGRTLPVLLGLIVLLTMTESSWLGREGAVGEAGAPRAGAPNVVFITLDTVRAQSLSLYGYERPTTPELERLATRGLVFERAYAPAPWTLATHASLFTGYFPHELSIDWDKPLDAKYPTLAQRMHELGYATAGFVANLNYCGYESGLGRGFAHYEDYPRSLGQLVLDTSLGRAVTNSPTVRDLWGYRDNLNRKPAGELNEDFLSWVEGVGDRPFFAFLNYYDAHSPYLPPPEFEGKFGEVVKRGAYRYDTNMVHVEWEDLTAAQVRMERDSYDAAIAYLDAQIGSLVDELERRELLDNTLVIITADHGEQFGEHDLFDHGNSLYVQNIKSPLLVLFPGGARAGSVVETPVSLRDLAATVLGLVGDEGESESGSRSLARWWADHANGESEPNIVLSEVKLPDGERSELISLVVGRYSYIRYADGTQQLYDVEYDPEQLVDLSGYEEGRKALEKFEEAVNLIRQGRR